MHQYSRDFRSPFKSSLTGHSQRVYPPPPGQDVEGLLKKCLGTVEQQETPMYGQLPSFGGGGSEGLLGLGWEDLQDDVFNPPPPKPLALAGPSMCTHHLTFVTRSAADLHPVRARGGEVLLSRGPYQLELAKDGRTNGNALLHWAIAGFWPPERPARA